MNKSCFWVVAALAAGMSYGETKTYFSNNSGDYALDDARNWTDGILPEGGDYTAYFGATTTDATPYIMTNEAPHKFSPFCINHQNVNTVFDLGAGNSFVARHRFFFNQSSTTMTIKSGIVGVDWDSSSGERFFMGDSMSSDSTINVDGVDAILSTAKNNAIQIGVNWPRFRVNVKNGGLLRGHVRLSNSGGGSTDNVLWIEGADSRMEVPTNGTVEALVVGGYGDRNVCVITNQAAVRILSGNVLAVGSSGNGYTRVSSTNRMEIVDHSSVYVKGTIKVSDAGSQNLFYVAGGSVVTAGTFTVSATPNNHVFDNGRACLMVSNRVVFADAGTHLETTTLNVGQNYCVDAQLVVTNGASVKTSGLVVGVQNATNSVLTVCKDSRLESSNLSIGSLTKTAVGNRIVVDGGTLSISNDATTAMTNGNMIFGVGRGSDGGVMEVTNGGLVDIKNLNRFRVGGDDGWSAMSNRLVITKGSTFKYKAPVAKQPFMIGGGKGAYNSVEVDGSYLCLKDSMLMIGDKGTGNRLLLTNGATCDVYRVIYSQNGCQGQTIDVNDSVFRTGFDSWGNYGSIAMGSNEGSTNHLLHIHGPRAYVYAADCVALARDSELRFTVEKGGFNRSIVFESPRGLKAEPNGSVTAEHPATIRINVAKDFVGRGTYTLIKTTWYDLDWTNINLVYDPRFVKIVEKTNRILKVKVSNQGLNLLVR